MAGIVRRIDELGRIVIPKEMRRSMLIREGEQIEMTQISNSEIMLKKYSQLKSIDKMTKIYSDILAKLTGNVIYIVDTSQIVSCSNYNCDCVGDNISTALYNILSKGEEYFTDNMQIVKKDTEDYKGINIFPIRAGGEIYGGVIAVGMINQEKLGMLRAVVGVMAGQVDN